MSSVPPPARSLQSSLAPMAPLITMGATWGVRRAMISAYEARTGKPAPLVYSRSASLVSKILWTATLAAVVTLVEVIIQELLDEEA